MIRTVELFSKGQVNLSVKHAEELKQVRSFLFMRSFLCFRFIFCLFRFRFMKTSSYPFLVSYTSSGSVVSVSGLKTHLR